jgi:hypothetical protein
MSNTMKCHYFFCSIEISCMFHNIDMKFFCDKHYHELINRCEFICTDLKSNNYGVCMKKFNIKFKDGKKYCFEHFDLLNKKCNYFTRTGKQCKNNKINNDEYCKTHTVNESEDELCSFLDFLNVGEDNLSNDVAKIKKKYKNFLKMNMLVSDNEKNILRKEIKKVLLKTHPDKNINNPEKYLELTKELTCILSNL